MWGENKDISMGKKGKHMGKPRHKYKRIIFSVILCYLIYLLIGAIAPFAISKKVSSEYKETFDITQFTNQEESVDRAAIVETSMDALNVRIAMIQQAKKKIVLTSFDIREGESTKDIFSALFEAANRGVKIQILVDGLSGKIHMGSNELFYTIGAHDNVEIKFYNAPSLLRPWTMNGRMHDKYLIIDDKLLLLGGRNTFDYFLGEYNAAALSDDREILIYNTEAENKDAKQSVIGQTEQYFNQIWKLDCNKSEYKKVPFYQKEKVQEVQKMLIGRYKKIKVEKPELFSNEIDWMNQTVAIKKATLISNPTHIYKKEPELWYQLQQLMLQANKRIWFHTPYAVMNDDMLDNIKEVAQRKVPLDLMINSATVGDNVMASSDYLSHREEIIQTGVNVYESFGKRSSHGKSLLIDDNLSVIGSYNLDMRSTYIDTEVAIVIYGEEFNKQLEQVLVSFRDQSLKVDQDGGYITNNSVKEKSVDKKKERFLEFIGCVTRAFRFLL